MNGLATLMIAAVAWVPSGWAARESTISKTFHPEAIKPGETDGAGVAAALGKPVQVVRDGGREYQFFKMGVGSTMDATVALRGGVVEYITYLCDETLESVKDKFKDEQGTSRPVRTEAPGLSGSLTQLTYSGAGRAFIYKPRSRKVRACVAWAPGRKLEDL